MALKVWTSDVDTVIAEDVDDVRAVVIEHAGSWESDEDEWHTLPDDHVLRIHDVDNVIAKKHSLDPDEHNRIALTCAAWIALEGRGFLCSTEY